MSEDDTYLQSRLQAYRGDPVGYMVDFMHLVKIYGSGFGEVTSEVYQLQSGIPVKQIEATINVEGDTDQAIAVYTWVFANTIRGAEKGIAIPI